MLSKKNRLTKMADFEAVFRAGRRNSSRFFGLRFLPNNLGCLRLAVVVSNKVSKKSTKRNVIKRRVRAMMRLRLSEFCRPVDLIINCFDACLGADYRLLENDLVVVLKKSGLI